MGEQTEIEWCDHTFNPWIGCTKVAAGCVNCYAEALAKRTGLATWGPSGTRVRTSDDNWRQPIKWDARAARDGVRRRVFCASLADVFESWDGAVVDSKGRWLVNCNRCGLSLPGGGDWPTTCVGCWLEKTTLATMTDLRNELFELIDITPNLDWLILTKRPENIETMWPGSKEHRPNVWLGTSVANSMDVLQNLPQLYRSRHLVPVLFLSAEPLLEPIDISSFDLNLVDLIKPHWLIVGGESGPKARPCDVEWIEAVINQCQSAGVPVFVKQLGSKPTCMGRTAALRDKKGGDPSEWPVPLRVREFPRMEGETTCG